MKIASEINNNNYISNCNGVPTFYKFITYLFFFADIMSSCCIKNCKSRTYCTDKKGITFF